MTPGAAVGLLGDTPMVPFGFHTTTTPLSEISFNMSPSIFSPNGRGFQLAGIGGPTDTPFISTQSSSKHGVAIGDMDASDRTGEYSPVVANADLSISSTESQSALQVLATMSAQKSHQPRNSLSSPASGDIRSLVSQADTPYDMRGAGVQLSMELGGDGAASSAWRHGIASGGRARGSRQLPPEDSNISPIAPLEGATGNRLYADDVERAGNRARSGFGSAESISLSSRRGLRSSSSISQNTTSDDTTDSSLHSRFGMAIGNSLTPQSVLKKRCLLDVSADMSGGLDGAMGFYDPQDGAVNKRLNTSSMSAISSVGEESDGRSSGVTTPYRTRSRASAVDRR